MIQNVNHSYQTLATQMWRIAYLFSPVQPQNNRPLGIGDGANNQGNQGQQPVAQAVEQPATRIVKRVPGVVLVDRNQNADEVVRQVQQNNLGAQNNIANLVETIIVQNGLNVGIHMPNFVSDLSEYVLQTKLPSGWKVPKFTKFTGDTDESTYYRSSCLLFN